MLVLSQMHSTVPKTITFLLAKSLVDDYVAEKEM